MSILAATLTILGLWAIASLTFAPCLGRRLRHARRNQSRRSPF
jgi:hypothetical protein